MASDRVGVYRAQDSENEFIVVVGNEGRTAESPVHRSNPLALDEAKNLLRHYNLTDNEIDLRIEEASQLSSAAGSGR